MDYSNVNIANYLGSKGVQIIKTFGDELTVHCLFDDCDKDSRAAEAHLYINSQTGQYQCKKCEAKGNLVTLAQHFGDSINSDVAPKSVATAKTNTSPFDVSIVEKSHCALPPSIRQYLNGRGITDELIIAHKLGWGEFYGKWWITIPIPDQNGAYSFLKLRRDPDDLTNETKYKFYPTGNSATLYGWESLKNDKKMVVVSEGEFDRMVLLKHGIPAVTSTAGAGTFKEEWIKAFKGIERIYLCLDNDKAGQYGTKRLTELFSKYLPQCALYSITFPERMISGKDVSDYFNDFQGTSEELLGSCAKLLENKEFTIKKGLYPISIAQLMSTVFPKNPWLIKNLLPQQGITALSGQPACYKTWTTLHIAMQVAKGEQVFDHFDTTQGGVLIIDEENTLQLLQDRLNKLHHDSFELPIYFSVLTGFKLTPETVEYMKEFIELNNIKLIIFDSLVRIHSYDENDAGQMSRVFELFRQLTTSGTSILFTHHHRKGQPGSKTLGQEMRGSSDILAGIDSHLSVEANATTITINQTKLRQAEHIKPFSLNIVASDDNFDFTFLGEVTNTASVNHLVIESNIIQILEEYIEPMSKTELFSAIKTKNISCGMTTLKSIIRKLIEQEKIYTKQGEKNKVLYSLTPFVDKIVS